MAMDKPQRDAFGEAMTAGQTISRIIIHAKAPLQPLALPEEVVAKLIEAQQALFAAQRLMEAM